MTSRDMNRKQILLVEDQPEIADLLCQHLKDMGADVTLFSDGSEALSAAKEQCWDLALMDISLPGASGLEICRTIRQHDAQRACYTPVILLTARTSEVDRVLGLEAGADDYISKPFSVLELIARIRAQFRRTEAQCPKALLHVNENGASNQDTAAARLLYKNLMMDTRRHEASLGGQALELTAREFSLLNHFIRHPGQVFSRAELLNKVWGYGYEGYEHTVNSHINRLRSKLTDASKQVSDKTNYIVTVWGVGYKLDEAA